MHNTTDHADARRAPDVSWTTTVLVGATILLIGAMVPRAEPVHQTTAAAAVFER
jgi:hypothetical protein